VHDNNVSSQHRCSNCYSLGHNSCKCPYPRKRNRKNRNSRSKKRGSVNKVAVDSDSDTNSSDNDSSDNNSDSENSSSEAESDHSFNIHSGSKKRQSLKSPIQRSSQKIQKNSGTIVDKQIRKMILDMFNDPDIIETIKNNIFSGASTKGASFTKTSTNNIIPPITNSDFTNYREPSLVSDQISQEVDSNEGDNEPLEEEWHAPMDFSLESTNSTLKKNA
ncbi:6380_t:CDS:2, partial [Entrophospora sp. SA101]